jgi:glycosyltransferase involved in cell wall biosynthesis
MALGGPEAVAAAVSDGVELRRLGTRKYRGQSRLAYMRAYAAFCIRLTLAITAAVRRRLVAVWINNPPDALVFTALPARMFGVRVVLDVHDMTSDLFAAKFGASRVSGRLVRAVEGLAYRIASGIATVHAPYRDRIAARVPGKPIIDVLNVPDYVDWPSIGDARVAAATEVEPGVLVLGHHGTIVERFGADIAVRAVAILRDRGMRVRLSILGDGDFAPQLSRLVEELGVEEEVRFDRRTFRPEEVAAFAGSIDIGLAPYRPSTFMDNALPVKVLEYLVLGVAVIATPTTVTRRYIGEHAIRYLEVADPEHLANAISELADSQARLTLVAHRDEARQLAWPAQRERLLDWFAALVRADRVDRDVEPAR